MSIEIQQDQQGAVRILALSGRLDTETSADLELALQDLQAAGANHFLIDLSEIGYVSSAGLRVLLALAKQLEGSPGSLRLCSLNTAVKQVFDVAGFSKLFAIFPNRAAALSGHKAAKAEDTGLARSAANLMGAPEADAAGANPAAADIARAAARLLGGKSSGDSARPAAEAARPRPQAPAKPAPAAAPPAKPEANAGVASKLRNLFGNKS